MLQFVIKFLLQNALKSAGPVLAANGIATSEQWQTVCGVAASAIGWIWHWHESHAAAVASGALPPASLPPGATLPSAGAKMGLGLIGLLLLPVALLTGCGGLFPKDVAHAVNFTEDGTKIRVGQDPVSQMPQLIFGREQANITVIPIIFQTNAANGQISAVVPETVESYEFNGRNTTFGGIAGTITFATGSNAVQTVLGGGHAPINEGTGTTLPK
jgi:hypothetical protein